MRQTAGFVLKNNEDLSVLDELDDQPEHHCDCGHHHGHDHPCGGHHHG